MNFVEHKLLQGHGAGKWLPFARSKVAILHQRALRAGITALSQRWQLDGGDVDCAVRVVGDQRYIHIRRKSCPVFASGLADGILNSIAAVYPLVPLRPLVETTPQSDPNPEFSFQRFFPSTRDAGDAPRVFHNEPRLARNLLATEQLISSDGSARFSLKSGQFSAEMRKVVQVLEGMNEVVPYSQFYAKTHGVFVSVDGIRWVVEISVNGVVAWVMNVCTAQPVTAENGDALLPYTPLPSPKPQDIPAALAAGSYKVLCDNTTVLEFYTKTPFFAHCGWAFNATGHEASNVCFDYIGATAQSHMYRIDITEADNAPAVATMSLADRGFLFGTKDVHMKYPKTDGRLYSFDTTGPVPVTSNAPVYCWYNEDKLIVARYEFSPGSSSQTVDDGNPGNFPCASDLGRDLKQGGSSNISIPTISIDGLSTPGLNTTYTGSIRQYTLGGVAGGSLANFSVAAGMEHSDIYDASIFLLEGVIHAAFHRATLIVPFYDREAAYLAIEARINRDDGQTTSITRHAASGESHFSECIEPCIAVPDRCVQLIAGAGGQADPPSECAGGGGIGWTFASFSFGEGLSTGAIIYAAEQDGAGCAAIQVNTSPDLPPDIILNPLPTSTTDYTLRFIGSTTVRDSLPIPTSPQYLVAFIEENETQRAVVIRDAFAGDRYIISRNTIGDLAGPLTKDDAGYLLEDILGEPNWVGVP